MTALDKQLVNRKAKLIQEDLKKLKAIKPASYEDYASDENLQLQVERLLERIIGRLIDTNYHILKERYDTIPTDYFESFALMGQKGQVEQNLSKELAQSAGLRNILTHEYDQIDSKKVYEAIQKALNQVPLYLQAILTTIQ